MTEHVGLTWNILKMKFRIPLGGIDYTTLLNVQSKEYRRTKNVIFLFVRFIVGPDIAGLKGKTMQAEYVCYQPCMECLSHLHHHHF